MITRFYLSLLSTNVKHPKFGCHVTSLCQGLRRSAGSGGEDPESQVGYVFVSKRSARYYAVELFTHFRSLTSVHFLCSLVANQRLVL